MVIFVYGKDVENLPWSNLLHPNAYRIPLNSNQSDRSINWSMIKSCIDSPHGYNVIVTSTEMPDVDIPENEKYITRLYPLVANM